MEAVSKEWHILISPRSPSGCALSLARNGQSGHAPSTKQSQQFGHVKGVPSISWAPGTGTLQGHREDLPFHLELDEVTSLDKHSGTVNLSLREDLLNHITVVYSFDTPTYPKGDRDYIGFATLPEQVHRKSVKRGFDFTLMVVGEAGLGKSTLVNSLFLSDLYKDRTISTASDRINKTTSIEKKSMDIEERGVKLRLTVVDTPGFGDAVNCEDSWRACCNYIDDQFRQYFNDESGLNRKNIQDNRVHCCLYFIPPYGHGLRQIDLELMRRLHSKVNIVPVIAKADTLTAAEVKRLKQRILQDIEENQIQIYQFPECDSDEDEEFKQQDRELKACVPFAVVGSNTVIEIYQFPECDSDEDEEFKQQDRELKSCVPFAAVGSNTVIEIYQFPECDSDEDEEFKQQDRELKSCVPFAAVGSNTVIEIYQFPECDSDEDEEFKQQDRELKSVPSRGGSNTVIEIYQFPECDSDEDEEFKQQDRELKSCVPFAAVGSNTVIEIYQFPECDSDEDEEFKQQDRELKSCVPFAAVGSNTVIEIYQFPECDSDEDEEFKQQDRELKSCVPAAVGSNTVIEIYQFPECDSDEDEEFKQQDRELKSCVPFAAVGSNTVIEIYQFPECDSDEDEEFKQQDRELKSCVPFAAVGSNTVIEVGGFSEVLRYCFTMLPDTSFQSVIVMRMRSSRAGQRAEVLCAFRGECDSDEDEEFKQQDRELKSCVPFAAVGSNTVIEIYQFPECDSDEDEEFKQQDRELKACVPFAVVGSNTVIEVGGCKVRGRQYPWGVVEVENPKHSDFSKLRNMLITTHMQDLKDITEDVHYENFRAQCISQISQASRERGKLKRDSGPALEGVITETDRLLLQKDEEIRRMQDMLTQMQEKLKATASRDSIVNV
ncbi:Septin-4 [Homalodisca vitripennis]|nr:Septin-4 [Homalodisca vitripennis]